MGAKGGTEKVFCTLANALSKRGFAVTMLCCDANRGETGFPVDEKVRFLNVGERESRVERFFCKLKSFSFDSKVRKRKREFCKIERLARLFGKSVEIIEQSDVVISFQPETTYLLYECLRVKTPVNAIYCI